MNLKRIFLIFCSCLVFFSCNNSNIVNTVKQQTLFSINYGKFEDELDLFSVNQTGSIKTFMTMEDGVFFIANGESKKILKLSSYGDVIGIYYDPLTNPTPNFEKVLEKSSNKIQSTQHAIQYQFNDIGKIISDEKKNFYVTEKLPLSRQEQDENNKVLLQNIVLRFADNGKLIDYIGQQGPGGTPFPYIKNLFVTKNNELVVHCLLHNGSIVYWFSEQGYLKYTIPISNENLPKPQEFEKSEVFMTLDSIVPDYHKKKLYLKIDYHETEIDSSTKAKAGIQFKNTLIYPLDIETGKYEEYLIIPGQEETVSNGFSKQTFTYAYDFLGITENGWLFFMVAADSGFYIQMIHPNGQKIIKRHIEVDHQNVFYHNFSLSSQGIISALLAKEQEVQLVWWRTDTLLEAFIQ